VAGTVGLRNDARIASLVSAMTVAHWLRTAVPPLVVTDDAALMMRRLPPTVLRQETASGVPAWRHVESCKSLQIYNKQGHVDCHPRSLMDNWLGGGS
jgi:hypothetical protein